MSDADWMKQALALAKEAARHDEVPVGAVIVHQGKVIATGRNRREELQDPLSHAEIHAIQNAAKAIGSWRLLECTLVVTLEPCPMCLAACQQARIPRVVYAAQDPKGGAISLGYRLHEDSRTNHRFTVDRIEFPEAGKILTDFFRVTRSKNE
jgi:tRNA(adenine34) deaminase